MQKYLITLASIVLFLVAGYYTWTAISAKQKSDELLRKFKETDSSLSKPTKNPDRKSGVGAAVEFYPISSLKSDLILLIDSLKTSYEKIPDHSLNQPSKQLTTDTKRLLTGIQQLNKLEWDTLDSAIPDTIKYWPASEKFSEQRWYADNFENQPKFAVITYLNYLRNQLLRIQ